MKIETEIKHKIFSQYIYQYVNSDKGLCRLRDMDFIESLSWIELKSLENISDDDLNYLSELLGVIYPENFVNSIVENSSYGANPTNCIAAIDYLRTKGYALPYMDYLVYQLVELGVFKLI